ncbi:unnamed protein product [Brassicogethes aeneus]|uniref:Uncharacterized protein n=1 Tax=Brassicogethes aeneus TaxID=1431903 RepID=A0A9P0B0K7_BRAAE|nr:unnamed protein product [Brassicogethes aeneus]
MYVTSDLVHAKVETTSDSDLTYEVEDDISRDSSFVPQHEIEKEKIIGIVQEITKSSNKRLKLDISNDDRRNLMEMTEKIQLKLRSEIPENNDQSEKWVKDLKEAILRQPSKSERIFLLTTMPVQWSVCKTAKKRLIMGNLDELHSRFLKDFPDVQISLAKFRSLRPPQCILVGAKGTHNVCVYKTHQNVRLKIQAVRQEFMKNKIDYPTSYRDWLQKIVCENPQSECYLLECKKCPENLQHDSVAVHLFNGKLISHLKEKFGKRRIRKYFIFRMGQRHNIKISTIFKFNKKDFGIDAEWHFFATSHGKGACDGIGGTVKRHAYFTSLQKDTDLLLTSPERLFEWAKQFFKKIHFHLCTNEEHEKHREFLKSRFLNQPAKKDRRVLIPWTSEQKKCAQIFFKRQLALKKPSRKPECEELKNSIQQPLKIKRGHK